MSGRYLPIGPFGPILSRMSTRGIDLPDALDRFVAEQIKSGAYRDANEVIGAGLRLLKAQEEIRAAKLARLREAIQEGLDDIEAGRVVDIEWDDLDSWLAGLGHRAIAE